MIASGSPFSGLAKDRKITDSKLNWEMSFLLAAEYEATQLQHHTAGTHDNLLNVEVFKNIGDEERIHAGEFLRLLHELGPDEKKFHPEGSEKVEIAIRKMK